MRRRDSLARTGLREVSSHSRQGISSRVWATVMPPSPSVNSRATQNHTTGRLDHPWRSLKRIGRGRQEEGIIDHEGRMRVEREIARTTPKYSIPLKFERRGRRVCGNQRKLRSLAAGWTVARPRRHWRSRYVTSFTDVVGSIVGERLLRRCHVGVNLQPVAAACVGSGRGQEAQASNNQADNAAWLHRRQPAACHSCGGHRAYPDQQTRLAASIGDVSDVC